MISAPPPANPPLPTAPAIDAIAWLNQDEALTPDRLRGRVVLVHAFQMLCPACVLRSLPQLREVQRTFAQAPLQVIGLHTVFEHHDVMSPTALHAFVDEYRLTFPIAIDRPTDAPDRDPIPATMRRLRLQGTPSTVVIDHLGRLRHRHFGHLPDLELGVLLGELLAEANLA